MLQKWFNKIKYFKWNYYHNNNINNNNLIEKNFNKNTKYKLKNINIIWYKLFNLNISQTSTKIKEKNINKQSHQKKFKNRKFYWIKKIIKINLKKNYRKKINLNKKLNIIDNNEIEMNIKIFDVFDFNIIIYKFFTITIKK